jgi:AmmeMemoRadiSam system protein B
MATTTLRPPAVAGRFYPRDPEELRAEVQSYTSSNEQNPVRAFGCMVPHAGYVYSGHVAGAVFSRIEIPESCVVLCPNHTGLGHALAIMSDGAWETPLGRIPIDSEVATALKRACPLLAEDSAAHRAEHAIEVELPFLQMRQPRLRFVPIALGTRDLVSLEQLGLAIAEVITAEKHPILIVASSDMNHYESDAVTRVKDGKALERILVLDAAGLHEVVTQQEVSMCGFGPAIVAITAAKKLGAQSAELVKYATSGDVSGDRDLVVGYAGVLLK